MHVWQDPMEDLPSGSVGRVLLPSNDCEFLPGLVVGFTRLARLTGASSVATDDADFGETCTIASTDVHPPSSIGNASEHDNDILLSPPGSPVFSIESFA